MYKVVVTAGGAHSTSVKTITFQTKEHAVVFVTAQLNEILNNPKMKHWNISMQELSGVRQIAQK